MTEIAVRHLLLPVGQELPPRPDWRNIVNGKVLLPQVASAASYCSGPVRKTKSLKVLVNYPTYDRST